MNASGSESEKESAGHGKSGFLIRTNQRKREPSPKTLEPKWQPSDVCEYMSGHFVKDMIMFDIMKIQMMIPSIPSSRTLSTMTTMNYHDYHDDSNDARSQTVP